MREVKTDSAEFETGVVTGVNDGFATVELNLQPACENCGAKVVCVPDQNGKRSLKVANPLHANVGSRVAISESSDFLLKVSMAQYGIPFTGFILGILILYLLNISIAGIAPELILFAGGLAGLGLSALISRLLTQRLAEGNRSFFTVTKILSDL